MVERSHIDPIQGSMIAIERKRAKEVIHQNRIRPQGQVKTIGAKEKKGVQDHLIKGVGQRVVEMTDTAGHHQERIREVKVLKEKNQKNH